MSIGAGTFALSSRILSPFCDTTLCATRDLSIQLALDLGLDSLLQSQQTPDFSWANLALPVPRRPDELCGSHNLSYLAKQAVD